MRVTVVPSSFPSAGGEDPGQYLITYLINDVVAIDAGSLGLYGTPQEQARVKHVLLSHTHADHTASLPVFLENAYESRADCVTIHAGLDVLDALQRDTFNDRSWPDFFALSDGSTTPFVKVQTLQPHQPIKLEGLTIVPVPVNHVVPTLGFVITEGSTSIVIASDTGPTDALWRAANAATGLAAVFLEASFPNAMADLAAISLHLTPAQFGEEVRKLASPVPVITVHLKSRYRREILAELDALNLPQVEIGRFGHEYEW